MNLGKIFKKKFMEVSHSAVAGNKEKRGTRNV